MRFVFASNRSLKNLVQDGTLREDFAYRLERLQVNLLALAHRKLDIAAGTAYALAKVLKERDLCPNNTPAIDGLELEAISSLLSFAWPGNLRQLENCIARLVDHELAASKTLISKEACEKIRQGMLGNNFFEDKDELFSNSAKEIAELAKSGIFSSLQECLSAFSREIRSSAIEATGGDISLASSLINEPETELEIFIQGENAKS